MPNSPFFNPIPHPSQYHICIQSRSIFHTELMINDQMKRPSSDSPPSSPIITPKAEIESEFESGIENDDYAPSPSPSPTRSNPKAKPAPKKARSTSSKQPESNTASFMKGQVTGSWSPGWSSDKKEAIIERYISVGIKGSNLGEMCREVSHES